MTLGKLITEYAADADVTKMEKITDVVSDFVERCATTEEKKRLMKRVYGIVGGGHFNEHFAAEQIAEMYYTESGGSNRYAPYWTESELRDVFDGVKDRVSPYNLYDFMVVMNMMKSDQYLKLRKWFPGSTEDELFGKIVDEAVNWLDDGDSPFGDTKAWGYFNSREERYDRHQCDD